MPLRKITADEFARRLRDTSRESDKRFAFFLGAGCSVTSGIPAAGGLVRDHWLPRLRGYRAPHRHDHDEWAREEFPEFDRASPGASYGAVMERLFLHAEDRQREIERLCEGRFPGFGYATLASLMAMEGGAFNVALTTNFDDLVADALYLFTKARPLIIHHESLASFIRPTRTRPLVVKLHGDNRLTPQNTSEETERLQAGIEKQVRPLLGDRGIVFIGYGGNDQGIARMLEKLSPEALPLGVYWVSGQEPVCRLREWLESRDAIWVEKGDFDEFMLLVRDAFDLPHPERKRFEDVFERYTSTYKELSGRITALPDAAPDAPALKEAVKRTDQSFPNWRAVSLEAMRLEKDDPDQADAIYRRGLSQFPSSVQLLGDYAVFLTDIRKDHDGAEERFWRALALDPEHANNLGNYALFLKNIRKDYDGAEEHYQRALAVDPENVNILGNYAAFVEMIRKDYDGAEERYRRALALNPEHVNHLGNYASFLWTARKDYDGAEGHYRHALAVDPEIANFLGQYANFLRTVRKDYDGAEEHYRRALAVDPEHATNLGNYAVFLSDIRKDYDGAEASYQRALAVDPERANVLGNYAVLLEMIRKDYDGAEEHHRRALAVDPEDANLLGNYASFLWTVRKDYDGAEEHYRRALAVDPEDANLLGNFAGFLLGLGRDVEGLTLLSQAMEMELQDDSLALRIELLFYAFAHGPAARQAATLGELKGFLEAGHRSSEWDFSLNIEQAKRGQHPHAGWLEPLAAVITQGADLSLLEGWNAWSAA